MKKELNIQHSTLKTENSAFNTQNSKLPKGWMWVRLGEIAEIITGNTPSKKDSANYGNYIPFVKPPELNDCVINSAEDSLSKKGAKLARIIPPESVLVSCIGNLGKTGINSVPVAINQQINSVIFPKDKISPRYGFYYFQTIEIKKWLYKIASATTLPIVNKSKFKTVPLPLPPLPEQHRIVAKIEELFTKLDAGVEALKKAKEQIKRYRQAVLKYAFEGKLTEEWRKSFELLMLNNELKETQNPQLNIQHSTFNTQHSKFTTQNYEPASVLIERIKEERKKKLGKKYRELPPIETSELPALPKGWMWVRLGEIIYFIKGKKPKNLGDKNEFLKFPYINIEAFELKRFYQYTDGENCPTCEPDDILIVWDGARCGLVGRGVKGFIGSTLAKLECSGINKSLLYYFLQTQYEYINKHPRGVGIPHVEPNLFWNISFPFPPLAEQQKIVEEIEQRFSVADEIEKIIDNSLKQAERLRQSILKRAFEGKLVPQDPNDEPAEKLLERIRDEKIKRESEKKVKKKGGK